MEQLASCWRKAGPRWLAQADLACAEVLQQEQPGVVPAVLQLVSDEFNRQAAAGSSTCQHATCTF